MKLATWLVDIRVYSDDLGEKLVAKLCAYLKRQELNSLSLPLQLSEGEQIRP